MSVCIQVRRVVLATCVARLSGGALPTLKTVHSWDMRFCSLHCCSGRQEAGFLLAAHASL